MTQNQRDKNFALEEFLRILSKKRQKATFSNIDNTLTVRGDLTTPVIGFAGNLRVHGTVRASVDIGGRLTITGHEDDLVHDTGIGAKDKKIIVKARELDMDGVSDSIFGNTEVRIQSWVRAGSCLSIEGKDVKVICNEMKGDLSSSSSGINLDEGAYVQVNGKALISVIHGQDCMTEVNGQVQHDPSKINLSGQKTTLIAGSLKTREIDSRARVYVRGDIQVLGKIAGASEVYAGGKVLCESPMRLTDPQFGFQYGPTKVFRMPIGVEFGHGTLTEGRTLVVGQKGVRCAGTFNATVMGDTISVQKVVNTHILTPHGREAIDCQSKDKKSRTIYNTTVLRDKDLSELQKRAQAVLPILRHGI